MRRCAPLFADQMDVILHAIATKLRHHQALRRKGSPQHENAGLQDLEMKMGAAQPVALTVFQLLSPLLVWKVFPVGTLAAYTKSRAEDHKMAECTEVDVSVVQVCHHLLRYMCDEQVPKPVRQVAAEVFSR